MTPSDLPAQIKAAYAVAKDQHGVDVKVLRAVKEQHIKPGEQTLTAMSALLAELQTRWPERTVQPSPPLAPEVDVLLANAPAVNLTSDQDQQLIRNGYEPIAVSGKRPIANEWGEGEITPERLGGERARFPDAMSTGLRTGKLSVADIDIVDETDAAAHVKLARTMLGDTSLVRHGSKGAALFYRAQGPRRKIFVNTSKLMPGHKGKGCQKIEILGEGQQVVGFGVHPDTGQPYEWIGDGTPLTVPFASLPEVTHDQLMAYANAAAELFKTQEGYGAITVTGDTGEERSEPKVATGARVTWERFVERLSYIHPQFDGHRPDCYPQPDTRQLPYDASVWIGIGLCLRDGNIPWLDYVPTPEERMHLLEAWSVGDLWFDRTCVDAGVTTVPEQGVEARLGGRERDGNVTTVATVIKYAADAGCPLPPDDEPQAKASETFAHLTPAIELMVKAAVEADAKVSDGFKRSGNLSYRSMQDITPVEIDWLWPERLAAGKLTLIAGVPDDGKSQIAAAISATISKGGAWPFGEGTVEQGAVIWLTSEDTAADITVPRLMAAGANRRLIFELEATVYVEGGVRTFNIVDDLNELTALMAEIKQEHKVPVRAIVIDPISAYMGGRGKGDTWKNSDVRNIMTPLLTFIGKAGVSVIGITHLNKSSNANVLNRVIDSIALPALSRTTWLTATEKDDDGEPTGRRLILTGKKNIGRPVPGIAYRIKEAQVPGGKNGTIPAPYVTWDGIVAVTADAAMTENKAATDKTEKAENFLQYTLLGGPMSVDDIRRRAGEKHSWRTIERAKNRLNLVVTHSGFGPNSVWTWHLPDPNATDQTTADLGGEVPF